MAQRRIGIDIISDTVCPWCFIGKRRLERALAMRNPGPVAIRWRPFQLNPTIPREGIERQSYLAAKFGGAERAARQYERIAQAGREEGIVFRFDLIRRTPNTIDSHRLLRHAEQFGRQDVIAEALFQGYFLRGLDLGSVEALAAIAGEAGLDVRETRAFLESDLYRGDIVAEDEEARLSGITGVPCYVIEDSYAVSGAQSPEVFLQIFDVVREERTNPVGRSAAE